MPRRTGRLLALALLLALTAAAPAAANGTLTVTKSPVASAGTVTGDRAFAGENDPGGSLRVINCGPTCSASLVGYRTCIHKVTGDICTDHDQVVTLNQSPAAGWSFAGWSGACTGTGQCTPEMSTSRSVTANYSDTAPPTVALDGPVQDDRFRLAIDVGATAGDNWGVARVDFLLDGAVVATDTTAPYSASVDLAGKPDGDHVTVAARATDNAGQASALSSRTYYVDKHAGVVFTSPTPAEGSWVTSGTPQIGFQAEPDTAGQHCRVWFNGALGDWQFCSFSPFTPLTTADGTYSVDVEIWDAAGNSALITRTFKVDRTPPAVSITTPAVGSWRNSGFTPGFTAPGATATCAIDSGTYGGCGPVGLLADGAHTLHVKAVDPAGNTTIADRDFSVDTVGPVVSFTGGTPQGAILDEGLASFAWEAADGTPVTFACALDDQPAAACDAGDAQAYSGIADGPHTFKLDVTDAAGNTTHRTRGFTVNAEKPAVSITDGPQEHAELATPNVTFGFAATGAVEVKCSLDSTTTFRACSGNGVDALHGVPDGAHVFRVRVRDEADEVAIAARTFRVNTSAPDTLIDAGPAHGGSLSAREVTFAFHSTAPGSSFRCRFGHEGAAGASGPCSGPGATHSAGDLAPGRYVFEVQAVNALGTADASPARVAFTLVAPAAPFTVVNTWAWSPRKTMVRALVVKRLVPGATVSVTCKGKGCFKGTKQVKVAKGKAKLTKLFRKRKLGAKARIDIAVTIPGADGRVVRFRTRKGAIPKRIDLCLPAGSSKPGRC